MIGVITRDGEDRAAREFFQLFKTPWEFYVPGQVYELVITTTGKRPDDICASLIVVYGSGNTRVDTQTGVAGKSLPGHELLEVPDGDIPLYGNVQTFEPVGRPVLVTKGGRGVVGMELEYANQALVRVGYDLFQEVEFLLSQGQPPENAHIPTLELHASFLRRTMVEAGIAFVEIPPTPAGYDFTACLTHDVDFTGIREHKFDSTMFGFIYRAFVGSFVATLKGKMAWAKCWTNWNAVFSLPFVYGGAKEDFWLEFDRYMEIEKELGSTFFFIPFKERPGTREGRPAPKRRGAKYDLSKIAGQVRNLVNSGCEIGLHGIDAWQGAAKAQLEAAPIRELVGRPEVGIRMHWLYFDQNSPKALEEAGFSYDSTFGYNDAVGFRGGTAQVFSMPPSDSFLELPLTIQDTALFYPGRMHLSEKEAMDSCQQIIGQLVRFGGAMTVNWHTRSLSPERLWGDFYQELIGEVQKRSVWFATAAEVVDWFRMRRALRFEKVQFTENGLRLKIDAPPHGALPPFFVRVHHPKAGFQTGSSVSSNGPVYSDIPWQGDELTLSQPEYSRA